LQNSPLESSCVVVALIEKYSTSKTLNISPEKSHISSCDTAVLWQMGDMWDLQRYIQLLEQHLATGNNNNNNNNNECGT
jgi:hypothetical protein